jgi:hypothetical protein
MFDSSWSDPLQDSPASVLQDQVFSTTVDESSDEEVRLLLRSLVIRRFDVERRLRDLMGEESNPAISFQRGLSRELVRRREEDILSLLDAASPEDMRIWAKQSYTLVRRLEAIAALANPGDL